MGLQARQRIITAAENEIIDAHTLGRYAEDMAAKYLVSIGWRVLARNVRNQYGELDIVAADMKEKDLVIVEVRCRTKNKIQDAIDSVDRRKMRALLKASNEYIDSINWQGFWRIDLIAVTIDEKDSVDDWELQHVRDITR